MYYCIPFFIAILVLMKTFQNKLNHGLVLAMFGILLFACKEETNKPLVLVTPSDINISAAVDDVVLFKVNVEADKTLARFTITSKPDNGFLVTELDTIVGGNFLTIEYQYQVPTNVAGESVIFTFTATDMDGRAGTNARRVIVDNDTSVVLTETSGHTMYSSNSLNPDAYNLEDNSPQFSTIGDSTDRDIQDATDTSSTLSRIWISPAGGKLVKFQGFDFANATNVSVMNAYQAGTKLDLLSNLQINDIIITKLAGTINEKYVAIKITDIIDAISTENDAYIFSIKK